MHELPENLFAGSSMVKEIFPSLRRTVCVARIELKRQRAANHAIFLQNTRRAAAGCAVRNCDENAFVPEGLVRLLNSIPEIRSRGSCNQQQDHEKSKHV